MAPDYWDADAKRVHAAISAVAEHRERRREESLIRVLARCAPSGLVLDAGMGDGGLLFELARRGYTCVGVDISGERVLAAQRRFSEPHLSATLHQGSVTALPCDDAMVDTVVCSEVLEHLDSPEIAVHELARVVRPGGHVVVSVPWEEDLGFDICPECSMTVPRHGHVRSFTASSLSELLSNAGLSVLWCRGLGSGPLLRGPAVRLAEALPFGLWRIFDWIARRVFPPEWIVVQARRPKSTDEAPSPRGEGHE
jgi:SAM-dependent methyltransferase